MIFNKIQYIIDSSGNYLLNGLGSVKATSNYSTIIELVAPFPINDAVKVNYLIYDTLDKDFSQSLELTKYTGKDVVDSKDPLFQQVKDFNVWQVQISQKALAYISRYRAGKIGVSFTIREEQTDSKAIVFKGKFGINDLPKTSENIGDYYECELYDFYSTVADIEFTRGEIAIWSGIKWEKGNNWIARIATSTSNIPVDPSVLATIYDTSKDEDIIEQLEYLVEEIYKYILEVFQKQIIHDIKQDNIELPIEDGMVNIDLTGFLKNPTYDEKTHTFTMDINNGNQFKIDFPIEALIENIELNDNNELVITFEDGTIRAIPLNALLVGVVKSVNGKLANTLGQVILTQDDINPLDKDLSNPTDERAPTTKLIKTYVDAKILDIIANTIKVNNTLTIDGKITSTTGDIDFNGSYAKNLKTIMELDDDDEVVNKGYVDTEVSKIELGADNVKLTGNQTINGVKTFTSRPKFNEKNIVVEGDTVRRLAEGVTTGQMWSSGESNIASLPVGQERDIKIVFTVKGATGASVAQIGFTDNELVYRMGYIVNQPHAWRRISGTVDTRNIDTIKIKKYTNNQEIIFNSRNINLVAEKYSNFKLTILGSINVTLNGDYETINIPAFDKGIPIAYFLTKLENGKHILNCPEHETDKYLLTVYEN